MNQEVTRINKMNSNKEIRLILVAVNLIVCGLIMAPMVAFAQPTNDEFNSATVIETLPFTDSINTIDATISKQDPIATCIGEQGHTVWYTFTPSSDMRFEVNTFESDYDTVLSVYTGSRRALNEIACNDDAAMTLQSRVRFDAIAETTYYIMVGSFYDSEGGNLVLNAGEAPPPLPPLRIELNIDPVGSVNLKNMAATIHGTMTCSRPVFADLSIGLMQRAGREIIHGYSYDFLECDGETPWEVTVTDADGVFAGGKAAVNAYVYVFDPDEDAFYFSEASKTIQLKGK